MKADRKAYQDQKQVQKLGNQRGDGSTGNAHSGGTQLSEDEQIVQPGVRRYRAKTCPKGDSGVFLAAQPCGQNNAGIAGGAVPQGFKAGKVLTVKRHSLPCRSRYLPEQSLPRCKGAAETVYPLLVHYTVFYQYIPLLYAVTWVAFSFTELIVSISSLPVLPSNRRVNRMGWSKGGFIRTALLST